MVRSRVIHYCNFCNYKSDRKYDRDKHVDRKHGLDNTHTTKDEDTPKAEAVGQYSIKPTSHYESTSPEIYPPNTVTMEEHNNVVEIANGWKTACENLQHSWNNECEKLNNLTKSGVFTREYIDKELINAVIPW